MKSKDTNVLEEQKKFSISTALYIVASIVALIGIALLIDNIYVFKTTLSQYVAQGYPAAAVMKSLLPSQLLPGIFEPIAVYGGIAFALLGIGIANKKITNWSVAQANAENENSAVEESIMDQATVDAEITENSEQAEALEESDLLDR
jgi:hypothetical protein